MGERKVVIICTSVLFATFLHISHGCRMEDVNMWALPVQESILDTFRGTVISRQTWDIEEIITVSYAGSTISPPYFDITLNNAQFEIRTNEAFANYEEVEVATRMSITVSFRCTGAATNNLLFWIDVTDTNNHAPRFMLETEEFEFVVAPPLPPGYLVTGCLNDITVRDVDLTTLRIDFTIEENPYFEIEYDEAGSSAAKEFKARLRTTTFIRSLSEPIELRITATDVDETNDPPLSATATVRVVVDSEFQFPEEPIFGQTFYLANYTEDHQLHLFETISLLQGFDEYVNFTLEGEYESYFSLKGADRNHVTIEVLDNLPSDVWSEEQFFLIVRANREFTSGASATVIVRLPEEVPLQFERGIYKGTITNNSLQLAPLVLTQGYEGGIVTAEPVGEYSTYFTAKVDGNLVTLTMAPLIDNIIDNYSFISLQVVVTSDRSSATTVLNLEIIKDDNVTPVFDKSINYGTYDPVTGLTAEKISFVQGFDDTVAVDLEGEYKDYFRIVEDGPIITITSSTIPPEIYSQQNILISIVASKPRTVGANAVIHIALPAEVTLQFERGIYEGTITNNSLQLAPLILTQGYEGVTVTAEPVGEHSTYFTATVDGNLVSLTMAPLLDNIIDNYSFISLQVVVTSDRSSATTVLNLEIIKDDNVTPVFDKSIYYGTYDPVTGLTAEKISFVQGFDDTVAVDLEGEYKDYFRIVEDGPIITITSLTIPPEIYSQQNILISIVASKPRTVGANAVIHIALPAARELEFEASYYRGTVEGNDELTLETILLRYGYEEGVRFELSGAYASYFNATNTQHRVDIVISNALSESIIRENRAIILTLTASGVNAVTTATNILLDLIKDDTTTPVFTQHIYYGTYSGDAIQIDDIHLVQGFDDDVSFRIDGVHSQYFNISDNENNTVTITQHSPIPKDVIFSEKVLLFNVLADKAFTVGANAAVLITFPTELTDSAVMRFSQNTYVGALEENEIALEDIVLDTGFENGTQFLLTGDYYEHFVLSSSYNVVQISSSNTLPQEVIDNNDFIVLEVEARRQGAVSTWASVVIHLVQREVIAPVFSEAYYTGVYAGDTGLIFDDAISLSDGYDETVTFDLDGESSTWFRLVQNNDTLSLVSNSSVPVEVVENNNQLLFTVLATKPDAAAGRAVISIDLPKELTESVVVMRFSQNTYVGTLEENEITLEDIVLDTGFANGTEFLLTGDYYEHFLLSSSYNVVQISSLNTLPKEVVENNDFIVLEVEARRQGAVPTWASVVIHLVQREVIAPVFSEAYYTGVYTGDTGLIFDDVISLSDGYDETVTFDLDGESSTWFRLVQNNDTLSLVSNSSVPVEVVENNNQLLFTVLATKPDAAAGRAVISIDLPKEITESVVVMRFSQNTYVGALEENEITLEDIVLDTGFANGTEFLLTGDYYEHFLLSSSYNVVQISSLNTLPKEVVENNDFIVLEVEARRQGAVPTWASVVIHLVQREVIAPVFSEAYYTGVYTGDTGLIFKDVISLSQGNDETVTFELDGESSTWFRLVQNNDTLSLVSNSSVPVEVVENNNQLLFTVLATKPDTAAGRAVISIDLPKEITESIVVMRFSQNTYVGALGENEITLEDIVLDTGFANGTEFLLTGDYYEHFLLSSSYNVVQISSLNTLPQEVIDNNDFIVLEVEARRQGAVPTWASVVIHLVQREVIAPVFSKAYYTGVYTGDTGLIFDDVISLSEGNDETVTFELDGESSTWFRLVQNNDTLSLVSNSSVPVEVVEKNNQLLFTVLATKPDAATGRAVISIDLAKELTESVVVMRFSQNTYVGALEENEITLEDIVLDTGFANGTEFLLTGDYYKYFLISSSYNVVQITSLNTLPKEVVENNDFIVLEVEARRQGAVPTWASVVIHLVQREVIVPVFSEAYYTGVYTEDTGLIFEDAISLSEGNDETVTFELEGESSTWFRLVQNNDTLFLVSNSSVPVEVVENNNQLLFTVLATKPDAATGRAVISIDLPKELTESVVVMRFSQNTYVGALEENEITLEDIVLDTGFANGTKFLLTGDYYEHFLLSSSYNVVQITSLNTLPKEVVENNDFIVLEVEASRQGAVSTWASVVIHLVQREVIVPVFSEAYYTGVYTVDTGLIFEDIISLSEGNDETVTYDLDGESSTWFRLVQNNDTLSVVSYSSVPVEVVENNNQLLFTVLATKPDAVTGRAVISIDLPKEKTESVVMRFSQNTYVGTLEENEITLEDIVLDIGFANGTEFLLTGDYYEHFVLTYSYNVVQISSLNTLPKEVVENNDFIVLEVEARRQGAVPTWASVVIHLVQREVIAPVFSEAYYTGVYTGDTGLIFDDIISLSDGYDKTVTFDLDGESSTWFRLVQNNDTLSVVSNSSVPVEVVENNNQLLFTVLATKPDAATGRAVISIDLPKDLQVEPDVAFHKILFEGIVQNGVVNHEIITINGFSGSIVELHGEYSPMFTSELSSGVVTISALGSLSLPSDVTHVPLELRAATASAVLLLNVIHTDVPPVPPLVTFSSSLYAVRVEITQTGRVGQVQASADNGEALSYSLHLNNAHLEERLSINSEGELHLSAPANTGSYAFEVVATTIFTQTTGTATVHLSVEVITVCGDELVMPPLIVVDVDEEEPHYDLINGTQYENCQFSLSNRWPLEHNWLYVDEGGLHTTAIDREHESIAFMPVSQVQVEVILHCEGDATRHKRSLTSDTLGPYDYGSNKWILTDTIAYNSRRSLVNVIVNDINDNAPIFVDKPNEPIAVGYPVPELAERVLPRSLVELQATDADIGENAALRYWSAAPELAVASATGFVHVRDGATLHNNDRFTVHATDRNGEGLMGSIDILVRLLDENYIAVVTIRNAFLDDEQTVVTYLTEALGYEVKVLRAVVISGEVETDNVGSRKNKDVTSASGASLQLYLYGLIAREPVSVDQLTTDINNVVIGPVSIASTVSLQDHLEAQEICAGRDVGLLVSTIVLSALLFIVLVAIAVWFYLRWRQNKNYEEFSDDNSLASRNVSVDKFPRPEILPKPRLDIGELKKSERRLQEMLDAPIDDISVEPTTSKKDAILDMPAPEPNTPIVIQSIDKLKDAADESSEDEFGETRKPKRKSVVTFNENVEKIIHVEDTPDAEDINEEPDYEVYKL